MTSRRAASSSRRDGTPPQRRSGVAMTTRNAAIAEVSPASRTPPLPAFLLDAVTGTPTPESPVEAPERRAISPEAEKAGGERSHLVAPHKAPPPGHAPPLRRALCALGGRRLRPSRSSSPRSSCRAIGKARPDQLRRYLSLNRGEEKAASRAHFYLGQALAYAGASREAFFEFLSARALHPTETEPWIDYVLASLRQKG